jgi:hypothetical protein
MPGFYTGGGATPADVWGYIDRRLTRAPALKRLCWSGADGDASFTPTTATTYTFPRPIMFYRRLVIGSLATLRPPSGVRVQILCISDTLQLDGVIDVSGLGGAGGAGASGGGAGGAGGGGVIVIARRIVGTGRILANGLRGVDARAPSGGAGGSSGSSGVYRGYTISAGGAYCSGSPTGGGGGGAGVWGNGGRGPCGCCGSGGVSPKHVSFLIPDIDIPSFIPSDGYGAGGGGGGGDTVYFPVAGGGGGGGGGLIVVMSDNPIPAITLSARGGDGGNTYGYSSHGGGGGGGFIIIVAPGDSSSKDVSGGATGGGGTPGEPGLIRFIQASAYEVI